MPSTPPFHVLYAMLTNGVVMSREVAEVVFSHTVVAIVLENVRVLVHAKKYCPHEAPRVRQ